MQPTFKPRHTVREGRFTSSSFRKRATKSPALACKNQDLVTEWLCDQISPNKLILLSSQFPILSGHNIKIVAHASNAKDKYLFIGNDALAMFVNKRWDSWEQARLFSLENLQFQDSLVNGEFTIEYDEFDVVRALAMGGEEQQPPMPTRQRIGQELKEICFNCMENLSFAHEAHSILVQHVLNSLDDLERIALWIGKWELLLCAQHALLLPLPAQNEELYNERLRVEETLGFLRTARGKPRQACMDSLISLIEKFHLENMGKSFSAQQVADFVRDALCSAGMALFDFEAECFWRRDLVHSLMESMPPNAREDLSSQCPGGFESDFMSMFTDLCSRAKKRVDAILAFESTYCVSQTLMSNGRYVTPPPQLFALESIAQTNVLDFPGPVQQLQVKTQSVWSGETLVHKHLLPSMALCELSARVVAPLLQREFLARIQCTDSEEEEGIAYVLEDSLVFIARREPLARYQIKRVIYIDDLLQLKALDGSTEAWIHSANSARVERLRGKEQAIAALQASIHFAQSITLRGACFTPILTSVLEQSFSTRTSTNDENLNTSDVHANQMSGRAAGSSNTAATKLLQRVGKQFTKMRLKRL